MVSPWTIDVLCRATRESKLGKVDSFVGYFADISDKAIFSDFVRCEQSEFGEIRISEVEF